MLDTLTIKEAFSGLLVIIAGLVIIKDFLAPYLSIKTRYSKDFDIFKEDMKKEFSEVKVSLSNLEEHKEEQKELLQLVLEGVTASLMSLKDMGANGTVTTTLKNLEDYKNQKAVS